jgi:hypothetical protein
MTSNQNSVSPANAALSPGLSRRSFSEGGPRFNSSFARVTPQTFCLSRLRKDPVRTSEQLVPPDGRAPASRTYPKTLPGKRAGVRSSETGKPDQPPISEISRQNPLGTQKAPDFPHFPPNPTTPNINSPLEGTPFVLSYRRSALDPSRNSVAGCTAKKIFVAITSRPETSIPTLLQIHRLVKTPGAHSVREIQHRLEFINPFLLALPP